jgi:hypothetical protein
MKQASCSSTVHGAESDGRAFERILSLAAVDPYNLPLRFPAPLFGEDWQSKIARFY